MTDIEIRTLAYNLSRNVPIHYTWEEIKDYCQDHSEAPSEELRRLASLVHSYLWTRCN
jgi:hypothetical protein